MRGNRVTKSKGWTWCKLGRIEWYKFGRIEWYKFGRIEWYTFGRIEWCKFGRIEWFEFAPCPRTSARDENTWLAMRIGSLEWAKACRTSAYTTPSPLQRECAVRAWFGPSRRTLTRSRAQPPRERSLRHRRHGGGATCELSVRTPRRPIGACFQPSARMCEAMVLYFRLAAHILEPSLLWKSDFWQRWAPLSPTYF